MSNPKVKPESITRGQRWDANLSWGVVRTNSLTQPSKSRKGQICWREFLNLKTYFAPYRGKQFIRRSLLIKCFGTVKTTRQGTVHGACFVRNRVFFVNK